MHQPEQRDDPGQWSRQTPVRARVSRRALLSRATYGVAGVLVAKTAPSAAGSAGAQTSARMPATAGGPSQAGASARTGTHALTGSAQPRGVCGGRAGVMVVGQTHDGRAVSWHARGSGWDQSELPTPHGVAADVWGVAAHGEGYLAVGSALHRDSLPVQADLRSPDTRASLGAQGAVGVQADDVTFASARRAPAVWTTLDGGHWTTSTIQTPARHAQLTAVSSDGPLLVAVGSTLDHDGVQGDGAFAMFSADGRAWTLGAVAAADGVLHEGSFTGVAYAGDRWFATSSDMTGGALWLSTDGRSWQVVDGSRATFAGMTLQGVGVRGRRLLVAATRLADQHSGYHVSIDWGRTWVADARTSALRTTGAGAVPPAFADVGDVAVVGGQFVAVGMRDGAPVIAAGRNGRAPSLLRGER